MSISKEVIEKHINNITLALINKKPKAMVKALYEFGHLLQIEHPDKDYIKIQEYLQQHYKEQLNHSDLSYEEIAKLHAIYAIVDQEYKENNAMEDVERREQGDLSVFMVNSAIRIGMVCSDSLLRSQTSVFDEAFEGMSKAINKLAKSTEFSNPIVQWIRTTNHSTNIAKKYNLPYLDALCKETQQNILAYIKELAEKFPARERQRFQDENQVIDPVKLIITFSENDHAKYREISIAIAQHKKMEELSKCLTNPKREPPARFCDFIAVCEKDETRNLLDISHLGRGFKEKISGLIKVLWKEGLVAAYNMWSQHKIAQSIQKIELEVGEIKKVRPGKI